MDPHETKSEISSGDESQEEKIKELPVEEFVQEQPKYQSGELGQLVGYLRDMVFLFDLRDCDWNSDCLSVVEKWFLEIVHPVLFIYYSTDNTLSASLTIPLTPFYDATYFIRQPNEIFKVDSFHDQIQYGTVHSPDESLLTLMEAIYAPHFFGITLEWSQRVQFNFLEAIDNFLINVTDMHYKMSGLVVIAMPPLPPIQKDTDEFTIRRLERYLIHWMGQMRLFLGDDGQKDLICPSDFYDFWVYRDEVLHGLILQFDRMEVHTVLTVLETKQSIYIKQFNELVHNCHEEVNRAADNLRFLALLIDPCKQLEDCLSAAEVPQLLPEIIRTLLFIQQKSKYLQGEAIIALFRALTNNIILFCRSKINILDVLERCPREGIRVCSMSIDCCLAYREIYDVTVNLEDLLDDHVIFNPIDTFVERLYNMILICEYSEINAMTPPQFGGTWGKEFEGTCQEMSKIFNEALKEITNEKDSALDVTDDRWSSKVIVRFKRVLKELDEIFQNMIKTAFLNCRNIDDRVDVLCTLINYQKRESLTECFNEYVGLLYDSIMNEVTAIKSFILEERTRHRKYVLCERYSGLGFFFNANLKRTQRLKKTVSGLCWLGEREEVRASVQLELEILEKLIQQDIKSNFEEWKASIPDDMIKCLQRSLLVRSLSRPGLLECNVDRNLVTLLREATGFRHLQFSTPINITQLLLKCAQINYIFESVVTICLDYNQIVISLTEKERLLFRPLIKACDKRITAGIYKFNWAGELTSSYAIDCIQLTRQIQELLASYKDSNMRIVTLCEQICEQEIMRLATEELLELDHLEDRLMSTKANGSEKLLHCYREILEQIVGVHEGLATYSDTKDGHDESTEWFEYVKKIDKLLEKAFSHCAQQNLQNLVQQLCGTTTLRILPFVRVQVLLDADNHALKFQPAIGDISMFLGSLFARLLGTFKLFQRLQVHLRIPNVDADSYFDVLKADEKCRDYHKLILKEIHATEMDVATYASNTWSPYQNQWSMDKSSFLNRFDAMEPSPESFHSAISKYAEIANQISLQSDDDYRLAIRYIQLNVTVLKGSIIRHIDEWQRLHMELLAKRSFKKLDMIYEQIVFMSKEIDVQPSTRQEMLDTLKLHERIVQIEVAVMEERFTEARNHFRIMELHNISVPVEHAKRLKGLDGEWEKFLENLKDAAETLQTSKDQFG